MSRAESYVHEINSLEPEIKRLNQRLKQLREQKKTAENHLYQYMVRHNLEKFEGKTLKKLTPKQKQTRKPLANKKADAIKLFRETGIPDPETFWLEFQQTQKLAKLEEQPKNGYDSFL
jgi:hypothetical protein